ncbi:amidohydrolase family protein [soil metagenome]
MNNQAQGRRDALVTLGSIAAVATTSGLSGCATAEPEAPIKWTIGTNRPRTRVPANAVDCHHHIYDSKYPWAPEASLKPGDGTVADYRQLQRRLGTTRDVIVQPSSYGIDNRLLLASLAEIGNTARGIAVVNLSVTDEQLTTLHKGGVRGIRFNLSPPGTTTLDMVKPLAARVAKLGWHVQVNAPAVYLLENRATWGDLPCPVVFDHMAHVPQPDPLNHASFAMVVDLLQRNKAYVKISGFYNETKVGPPTYSDSVVLAAALVKAAPSRALWGSDWPHPTEQPGNKIPDDALLLDLFAQAVPDEATRNRIFVDNPVPLYQFG